MAAQKSITTLGITNESTFNHGVRAKQTPTYTLMANKYISLLITLNID